MSSASSSREGAPPPLLVTLVGPEGSSATYDINAFGQAFEALPHSRIHSPSANDYQNNSEGGSVSHPYEQTHSVHFTLHIPEFGDPFELYIDTSNNGTDATSSSSAGESPTLRRHVADMISAISTGISDAISESLASAPARAAVNSLTSLANAVPGCYKYFELVRHSRPVLTLAKAAATDPGTITERAALASALGLWQVWQDVQKHRGTWLRDTETVRRVFDGSWSRVRGVGAIDSDGSGG